MRSFLQQHGSSVIGKISGWDRLRLRGTLCSIAHCKGLASPDISKEEVAKEIAQRDGD